jgi:type IV pilus assembly protein PilA
VSRPQRGFQIIEAIIIVSIVAILGSIALPAYQDYTIRAQVKKGLQDMASVQNAVTDAYMKSGKMPGSRSAADLPSAASSTQSKFVSSVDIGAGGVVTLTYGNSASARISGRILRLMPYSSAGRSVAWRCGVADGPAAMRSGKQPATSIEFRFLPLDCVAETPPPAH